MSSYSEETKNVSVTEVQYNGMYRGIVVQNNDPEMRGRVKILVPEHAPSITALNDMTMKGVVLKFKNIHRKASPEIDAALDEIKSALPWAEQASPLMGGVSSGLYNYTTRTVNNQDGGFRPQIGSKSPEARKVFPQMFTDDPMVNNTERTNPETYRGANLFMGANLESDPFFQTKRNGNHNVNPLTSQYNPSNYSGMARGMFSIPNVGAQVFLFYDHGDKLHPVYFAASFGQSDWRRIYTMSENDTTTNAKDYPLPYENNPDGDTGTFRAKTVFNTNKHTVEFIDTDGDESVKINAFSGSFKEFSNAATIELATSNDQKKVMQDQYLSVGGNKLSYVGYDNEDITNGNKYVTTGVQPKSIVDDIVALHRKQHVYKKLFPTTHMHPDWPPKECSEEEEWSGELDVCPICGHPSMEYMNDPSPAAPEMVMGPMCHDQTFPLSPSPLPYTGEGIFANSPCPSCLNKEWRRTPWYIGRAGYSPSTENGDWDDTDFTELINLTKIHAKEITKLEKRLGRGGDEIHKVSMSMIETIGMTFNDLDSIRTDPIGRLAFDRCYVAMNGCTPYYLPVPLTQYVDVVDIPGGDLIQTVMNKWRMTVGSRGIDIKSTGPVNIGGSITNIAAQELNLFGKNGLALEGGEFLNLRARKVVVSPKNHGALMVDGQIHCDRSLIVCGGAYFEGEVGIQHITCPLEWHTTWTTCWDYFPACLIPCCYMLPFWCGPGMIVLPRHEHYFESIPTTFTKDSAQTRMRMRNKGINNLDHIVKADKVIYEPKLPICLPKMRPSYQDPNAYATEMLPDNILNYHRIDYLDKMTSDEHPNGIMTVRTSNDDNQVKFKYHRGFKVNPTEKVRP